MTDLLLDSYIRRKRWEMREQAVMTHNIKAEAYSQSKGKQTQQAAKKPSRLMGMDDFLSAQGLE